MRTFPDNARPAAIRFSVFANRNLPFAVRHSLFALSSSASVVRPLSSACRADPAGGANDRRAGDPPARPADQASDRAGTAALQRQTAAGSSLAGHRGRARRAALCVPRHAADAAVAGGAAAGPPTKRCGTASRRARRRRCWAPPTSSPPRAASSKPCTSCCCRAWRTSAQGLDEQFADSLTSREILRSTKLSDAGRAALRDIINRVELTYFGQHPAALADYAACRASFNALAHSLHGTALHGSAAA